MNGASCTGNVRHVKVGFRIHVIMKDKLDLDQLGRDQLQHEEIL